MASIVERLQLVITADGKQAVGELTKFGVAADQQVGKLDDRLQRTGARMAGFGATTMAASAVAGVGLYKLANAASAVSEQLSATGVVFGKSLVPGLERYASTAAATAGISKALALQVSNNFGTMGKAAGLTGEDLSGFSTQLTQLGGDLASFKDTTVDEALAAIQSGLQGESEPLRRYGVFLDDATLKTRAMTLGIYDGNGALTTQQRILAAQAEIMAQSSDAQGDFVRTSDSLANRQRALAAEFENTKAAVGEGLVPIFETLLGVAGSVTGKFQELSPEAQRTVGSVAGIGVAGTAAAGGLAFVVGHGLKAVDTFKDLSGRLRDAEGNLTRVGKAAKLAGGIATVFAASELVFAGINSGTGVAKRATDAINDLTVARSKLDQQGTLTAVGDAVAAEQSTLRFQNLWQEFGAEIDIVGTGIKGDVEGVQRVFDSLDPANAAAALDALEASTETLDHNSRQYQINTEFIARNRESLSKSAAATAAQAKENGALDASWTGLIKSWTAGKTQAEQSADATEDFTKKIDGLGTKTKLVSINFDALAAKSKTFKDTLDQSTNVDNLLGNAVAYRDSFTSFFEVVGALPHELDLAKVAMGGYNEEQTKAFGVLAQMSGSVRDYLGGLIDSTGSTDLARAGAHDLWNQYRQVFEQLGFTTEQIAEYQRLLGLTDPQIETAISLSGVEESITKLQLLKDFVASITKDDPNALGDAADRGKIELAVAMKIAEGDLGSAATLLSTWLMDQQDGMINNPLVQAIIADTDPATAGIQGWKAEQAAAPPVAMQAGANTNPATFDVQAWAKSASAGSFGIATIPATIKIVAAPKDWPFFGGGMRGEASIIPTLQRPYPGSNGQGGVDFNVFTPQATGGMVGFANQVQVAGFGSDTVPTMLTPGEFVVTKEAVKRVGMDSLYALNAGAGVPHSIIANDQRGTVRQPAFPSVTGPTTTPVTSSTSEPREPRGPLIGTLIQHGVTAESSPTDIARGALRAAALVEF